MRYFDEECVRTGDMARQRCRSRFVKCHTSSGRRQAVDELLASPELQEQLKDVRAADEVGHRRSIGCLSLYR